MTKQHRYENPKIRILRACEKKALNRSELLKAWYAVTGLPRTVLDMHLAELKMFDMIREKKPKLYEVTPCGLSILKAVKFDPYFFD